jgi:hypothetical protein
MGKAEKREFNGVVYYKAGSYFKCNIASSKKGYGRLHTDVWRFYNGDIPKGYDIHHVDFDSFNNDISNLSLLPRKEHHQLHMQRNLQNEEYVKRNKKHLEKIRELTKEWHGSAEGLEWHRQHGIEVSANAKDVAKVCQLCGKEYTTAYKNRNQYCSREIFFCVMK